MQRRAVEYPHVSEQMMMTQWMRALHPPHNAGHAVHHRGTHLGSVEKEVYPGKHADSSDVSLQGTHPRKRSQMLSLELAFGMGYAMGLDRCQRGAHRYQPCDAMRLRAYRLSLYPCATELRGAPDRTGGS